MNAEMLKVTTLKGEFPVSSKSNLNVLYIAPVQKRLPRDS
jgi:hypothetical protein